MPARALISNVLAGGVIGVINISVAISTAALIFSGTKPEYFAVGVAILLIGTVVSGLGGTLASAFHGIIIAPRSGLAPVFASLIAAIMTMMKDGARSDAILPTIVMTIMVTAFVSGLVLLLLGQLKLGRLVRYVPYPVMGGFFAGIGFIFVQGGISVASGAQLAIDNLPGFITTDILIKALPAVLFAIALYWTRLRWGHWVLVPLFLALGFSAFYLVLGYMGETRESAEAAGWLPAISSTPVDFPVLDFSNLFAVNWSVVAAQSGGIATVAILNAIILLIDVSGIEIIASREISPNRELKVAGWTNMVNGLAGGYPGVHVATDTALTYKLGGDRRLMGFTYAGVVSLAIVAGTGFIGSIPTFILGGLLIYVGLDFLVEWIWKSRKYLPLLDYLVILVIFYVVAAVGILEGFAFGLALTVVLFVVTYSRLKVIRSELTGSEHASHVDRDPARREILNREGRQIWIVRLQGFIFFGTAEGLRATIKERVCSQDVETKIRYLVIDFRNVGTIDASAVHVFSKLAQLSEKENVHILVTEITKNIRNQLNKIGFFADAPAATQRMEFARLDDGVAWCEAQILGTFVFETRKHGDFEGQLTQLLGVPVAASQIAPFFESVEVTAGDYLFRQGETGDCMYLVHSGVAAVITVFPDGHERVIRIYTAGAILGEMAVYTKAPRSASVRIEESGLFYRLGAMELETMQRQCPEAAGLFHALIIRLLSERLVRANKEIQQVS